MKNSIPEWLKDNAWTLFVTAIFIAMAWATQGARVSAIEKKIDEYPSQEYFDLRFDNLEEDVSELKKEIKEKK